jgi:hypothetical protein
MKLYEAIDKAEADLKTSTPVTSHHIASTKQ